MEIVRKVEVVLGLIREDLEMAYGSDVASVNQVLGEDGQIGADSIQRRIGGRETSEQGAKFEIWKEGLTRELEGFEEELKEIQAAVESVSEG